MITGDVIALLGLVVAAVLALSGMWWRLSAKISAHTAALHGKIDRVKADYARRDDLASHMERLEGGQGRIIDTVDRLNKRLDQMLISWVNAPPPTQGE